MATVDQICSVVARNLGCSVDRARAMSAALGHAGDATFSMGADLIVSILAADGPEEAQRRVALYRRVPLAEVGYFKVKNKAAPDAAPEDFVIDAADLPALYGPGSGSRIASVSRSFGDALEELIRRLVTGDDPGLPYMVRAGRHDQLAAAYIAEHHANGSETILSFRATAHGQEEYALAAGRLNVSAEIGGSVFEALADLFRREAQILASTAPPTANLLVADEALQR